MSSEFTNNQMVVGILIMAIIIAVIIYFIFPTGQSESVRWPSFDSFFGFKIPSTPDTDDGNGPTDNGNGSSNDTTPDNSTDGNDITSGLGNCANVSGLFGINCPNGATGTAMTPSNCQLRCQSASECPAGLGCVEGICRCQSTLGGVCRKPSDCNCRLGIKCSLPEQKCVPNNFYYDFGEAVENCPTGVRRGYFYDPYILLMDGTSGDFQSGFRCV